METNPKSQSRTQDIRATPKHLTLAIVNPPVDSSWRQQANCAGKDSEIFFANDRDHSKSLQVHLTRQAKAICAGCNVVDECLEENLLERSGVFGGMTARERVRLVTSRRAGAFKEMNNG